MERTRREVDADGFAHSWLVSKTGKESNALKAEKALWGKLDFKDKHTGTTRTVQCIHFKRKGKGGAGQERCNDSCNNLSVMFSRIRVLIESLWAELHVSPEEQAAFASAHYYPETIDNYNMMFKEIQRLCRRRDTQEGLMTAINTRETLLDRIKELASHEGLCEPHRGTASLNNVVDEFVVQFGHLRDATAAVVHQIYRLRARHRICFPHTWCGQNYLEKVARDMLCLEGTPIGVLLQGCVHLRGNPLLLPEIGGATPAAVVMTKREAFRAAAELAGLAPLSVAEEVLTLADTRVAQTFATSTSATGNGCSDKSQGSFAKLSSLAPLRNVPSTAPFGTTTRIGLSATSPAVLATQGYQAPPKGCSAFLVNGEKRNKYVFPKHVYNKKAGDVRKAARARLHAGMLPLVNGARFAVCSDVVLAEPALLVHSARQAVLLRRCHALMVVTRCLRTLQLRNLPQEERDRRQAARSDTLKSCLSVFATQKSQSDDCDSVFSDGETQSAYSSDD